MYHLSHSLSLNFFNCRLRFDVAVTFEERVMDALLEGQLFFFHVLPLALWLLGHTQTVADVRGKSMQM